MKIVYYFNQEESVSPVKEFLLKYDIKKNDSKKTVDHKIKVLAFIDQYYKDFITNQTYEEYK